MKRILRIKWNSKWKKIGFNILLVITSLLAYNFADLIVSSARIDLPKRELALMPESEP